MKTRSRSTSEPGPRGCRPSRRRRGSQPPMGITASIVFLPGDGVGPEIVNAIKSVVSAVEQAFGHSFATTELLIGGAAIDAYGSPLRSEDLEACKAADGVLLGA